MELAPLDIALVGPWPPYRGGIAHFGTELGRALKNRGHVVHPVTFSRQYPERFFPGESQFEPEGPPTDQPVALRLVDALNPASWWATGKYLRDLNVDAVVFQHWMPYMAPAYGTIARRIVRRGGRAASRLALVHNALPHERRPGDIALNRYFLRACDGAISLSASVREDLRRMAPGLPIIQLGHPVYHQFGPPTERSEARRHLGVGPDSPLLLFFGFVRRYKGLDVLIDAMPEVLASHPSTRLVVAGEFYGDEESYRQRVRDLGLGHAIRFDARYIPAGEVPHYFGAADLIVQPYRSATQSGVAQTAFGFGRPVITTDVGGLAEAIQNGVTGLIVPPENPSALAQVVCSVLGDEALAQRLTSGARGAWDHRGWDVLCEAVEELASKSIR